MVTHRPARTWSPHQAQGKGRITNPLTLNVLLGHESISERARSPTETNDPEMRAATNILKSCNQTRAHFEVDPT